MHQPPLAPRTLSAQEFALLTARPETRILSISIVTILIGIVQGLGTSWPISSLAVIGGGVLAILGVLLFGRTLSDTSRSIQGALSALAGFVPYVYGLYLLVYEGLWGVRALFQHFSVLGLTTCLAFVYFGYRIVHWTWRLSEIAEGRRTGKILVHD